MSFSARGMGFGSFLFFVLLGTIGYFVMRSWQPSVSSPSVAATVPAIANVEMQTTSTVIRFGVSLPAAKTDRSFLVFIATGKVQEEKQPSGWKSLAVTASPVRLEDRKRSDGVLFLIGENGWSVPLRFRNSTPYEEVRVLGLFDDSHAALAARRGDRLLLSVSKTGEIRELYLIGETVEPIRAAEGSAYFSTFVPGEGIESPPGGPSSLIRVKADGSTSSPATEQGLIVDALPGPGNAYVYRLDDRTMQAYADDKSLRRGGMPWMWLDEKQLVFSQGTSIFLWDAVTGSVTSVADLPVVPSQAAKIIRDKE